MNTRYQVLSVAIAFLFAVVGCKSEKKTAESLPATFSVEEQSIKKEKITYLQDGKTGKVDTTKNIASINVSYPQVKSWQNSQSETAINSMIKAYADTLVANFKRQGGLDFNDPKAIDTVKVAEGDGTSAMMYATFLDGKANITQKYENFVGIVFDNAIYLGGAHPLPDKKVFNYDVKANKNLTLADILNGDYLKTISDFCRAELMKQKGNMSSTDEMINSGTEAKAENFDTFEITPDGLRFLFSVYQVAPYASGEQFVMMPYETVETMLNKDTVIDGLRKKK